MRQKMEKERVNDENYAANDENVSVSFEEMEISGVEFRDILHLTDNTCVGFARYAGIHRKTIATWYCGMLQEVKLKYVEKLVKFIGVEKYRYALKKVRLKRLPNSQRPSQY